MLLLLFYLRRSTGICSSKLARSILEPVFVYLRPIIHNNVVQYVLTMLYIHGIMCCFYCTERQLLHSHDLAVMLMDRVTLVVYFSASGAPESTPVCMAL